MTHQTIITYKLKLNNYLVVHQKISILQRIYIVKLKQIKHNVYPKITTLIILKFKMKIYLTTTYLPIFIKTPLLNMKVLNSARKKRKKFLKRSSLK